MEINGVTLEFDYYDADQLERVENGILAVQEGCGSLPEGLKLSESIRRQCGLVFAFFDGVFGEGTAGRVFGRRFCIYYTHGWKISVQAAA